MSDTRKPSTSTKTATPSTTKPASTTTPTTTAASTTDPRALRLSELQNLVQLATLHGVDVNDDVLAERDALVAGLAG
jgi:hypothetical protein